jgi:hypothetical protein
MLKMMGDREQELNATKKEIQDWNRKIEVIGDLLL